MVGEAVQRSTTRPSERPGEKPMGTLVQERSGLLPVPGRSQVADRALPDFDLARDFARDQLDALAQALASAHGDVVAQEDAGRGQQLGQRREDQRTLGFEAGGEQLADQVSLVAVEHQRRESVTLRRAPGGRLWRRCRPPRERPWRSARATRRRPRPGRLRSSSRSRISDRGEKQGLTDETCPRGSSTVTTPGLAGCEVTSLR